MVLVNCSWWSIQSSFNIELATYSDSPRTAKVNLKYKLHNKQMIHVMMSEITLQEMRRKLKENFLQTITTCTISVAFIMLVKRQLIPQCNTFPVLQMFAIKIAPAGESPGTENNIMDI